MPTKKDCSNSFKFCGLSTTFKLLVFALVTQRASEKLETLEIHYLTLRKMKWKLPFQSTTTTDNNIPIPSSSNRGLKRLWDECQVQVTEQGINIDLWYIELLSSYLFLCFSFYPVW